MCAFLQVNLTELKAFPSPPSAVSNVAAAVMVLLAPQGRVPKDRGWKAARVFIGKVSGWQRENSDGFCVQFCGFIDSRDWGGMDWEFGISRCKLFYAEWIKQQDPVV